MSTEASGKRTVYFRFGRRAVKFRNAPVSFRMGGPKDDQIFLTLGTCNGMSDLAVGHVSVGFSLGGAFYGWHPIFDTDMDKWEGWNDIMKYDEHGKNVDEWAGVTRDTDAEIYVQMKAASKLGFTIEVYEMQMDLDAKRVDAAESIAKTLVQDGSFPGFPTRYGHRHQSDGTFNPQATDCMDFLGHLGLLSFDAVPRSMKDLVEKWIPRSRRIDTLMPMPYMVSYSCLFDYVRMSLESSQMRSMTVPVGQRLVEENSHNSEIIFVVHGECSMSVRGTTIGDLRPGHFFGERQFLVPGPSKETVTAETSVTAIAMKKADLVVSMQSKAALWLYFLSRVLDIHISAVDRTTYLEVIDELRSFGHSMASRAGIPVGYGAFALPPMSPISSL